MQKHPDRHTAARGGTMQFRLGCLACGLAWHVVAPCRLNQGKLPIHFLYARQGKYPRTGCCHSRQPKQFDHHMQPQGQNALSNTFHKGSGSRQPTQVTISCSHGQDYVNHDALRNTISTEESNLKVSETCCTPRKYQCSPCCLSVCSVD